MISLSNIHVRLPSLAGEVHILRGVDLTLGSSEAVAVVGPSGSGKSTMMMVLAGLERASDGRIEIAGHDLTSMDEDALALFRRDNIGIVFQNFHLVPTMTALENVALPLEFVGRRDAFNLAGEGLAQVGLSHRLTHYPAQLSGGEQQRVALARACAARPRLLLADEPTGNLDGDTGQAVMDLLFQMRDRLDMTLLLITHEPRLAERCDRVIRMADGQIVDPRLATAAAAE
ncbi:MAG: ATP-binding cassette domain-containing protein [Rhodospirillaceae bacterium]|nr:ATP-binding cassette domain-containing protein [Rhodospirillaceae bacterium]MCY4310276.1 ATP-binding cassette domain-containing protein [Rhodospirillaceae bacterium]